MSSNRIGDVRVSPWTPEEYKVIRKLADGIHGHIYRAIHVPTNSRVVLKVFQRSKVYQMASSSELVENAYFEIESGFRLNGMKYCLRTFDVHQDNNKVYLVLEDAEGGDLFERLSQFSLEETRRISYQLLVGLANLHKHGFAHRDISLENVLLSSKGDIRLADFAQVVSWADDVMCMVDGRAVQGRSGEPCNSALVGRGRAWGLCGKNYYRAPEGYVINVNNNNINNSGNSMKGNSSSGFGPQIQQHSNSTGNANASTTVSNHSTNNNNMNNSNSIIPSGKASYDPCALDVFAAGVVIFMLATGCSPFDHAIPDDKKFTYLQQHGSRALLAAWRQEDKFPYVLCVLLDAMLQSNPAKRVTARQALTCPWFSDLFSQSALHKIKPTGEEGLEGVYNDNRLLYGKYYRGSHTVSHDPIAEYRLILSQQQQQQQQMQQSNMITDDHGIPFSINNNNAVMNLSSSMMQNLHIGGLHRHNNLREEGQALTSKSSIPPPYTFTRTGRPLHETESLRYNNNSSVNANGHLLNSQGSAHGNGLLSPGASVYHSTALSLGRPPILENRNSQHQSSNNILSSTTNTPTTAMVSSSTPKAESPPLSSDLNEKPSLIGEIASDDILESMSNCVVAVNNSDELTNDIRTSCNSKKELEHDNINDCNSRNGRYENIENSNTNNNLTEHVIENDKVNIKISQDISKESSNSIIKTPPSHKTNSFSDSPTIVTDNIITGQTLTSPDNIDLANNNINEQKNILTYYTSSSPTTCFVNIPNCDTNNDTITLKKSSSTSSLLRYNVITTSSVLKKKMFHSPSALEDSPKTNGYNSKVSSSKTNKSLNKSYNFSNVSKSRSPSSVRLRLQSESVDNSVDKKFEKNIISHLNQTESNRESQPNSTHHPQTSSITSSSFELDDKNKKETYSNFFNNDSNIDVRIKSRVSSINSPSPNPNKTLSGGLSTSPSVKRGESTKLKITTASSETPPQPFQQHEQNDLLSFPQRSRVSLRSASTSPQFSVNNIVPNIPSDAFSAEERQKRGVSVSPHHTLHIYNTNNKNNNNNINSATLHNLSSNFTSQNRFNLTEKPSLTHHQTSTSIAGVRDLLHCSSSRRNNEAKQRDDNDKNNINISSFTNGHNDKINVDDIDPNLSPLINSRNASSRSAFEYLPLSSVNLTSVNEVVNFTAIDESYMSNASPQHLPPEFANDSIQISNSSNNKNNNNADNMNVKSSFEFCSSPSATTHQDSPASSSHANRLTRSISKPTLQNNTVNASSTLPSTGMAGSSLSSLFISNHMNASPSNNFNSSNNNNSSISSNMTSNSFKPSASTGGDEPYHNIVKLSSSNGGNNKFKSFSNVQQVNPNFTLIDESQQSVGPSQGKNCFTLRRYDRLHSTSSNTTSIGASSSTSSKFFLSPSHLSPHHIQPSFGANYASSQVSHINLKRPSSSSSSTINNGRFYRGNLPTQFPSSGSFTAKEASFRTQVSSSSSSSSS